MKYFGREGSSHSSKHRSIVAVGFLILTTYGTSAFDYTNFSSTAGLNLVESATTISNFVRLTPASSDSRGAVWYAQKQSCASGFSTSFRFRFTAQGSFPGTPSGGDGVAFAVQNFGAFAPGTEIGAFSNNVAITFNTFNNFGAEPSDNFVGIVTNRDNVGNAFYYFTQDLNPTPIRLKDGKEHTAYIQYNGAVLTVSVDGILVITNLPVSLSPALDQAGQGWVGLSARTGFAWENHDVLSWSFSAGLTSPPLILSQPASRTNLIGETASFSVIAVGTAPLSYQWMFNQAELIGRTGPTLELSNVQLTNQGVYSVRVTNSLGSIVSSNAVLTVLGLAPAITLQPQSQTVPAGTDVGFSVVATGTPPLRYEWRLNGTPLPGATSPTLSLFNVQATNTGDYSVRVTNDFGAILSDNATLALAGTVSNCLTYANFASTNGLNLVGTARTLTNILRLTSAAADQAGAAWASGKRFVAGGFSSTFRLRISSIGGLGGLGGDGIGFSIQNLSATSPGNEYGAPTNSFAITFNTYNNFGPEPSDNFVGLLFNQQYVATRDLTPLEINLSDSAEHTAVITHNGTSLTVLVDNRVVFTNFPISLALATDSTGFGWVGLSARTGGAWENHDILSWSFCSGPTNRPPVAQPQTVTLNEDATALITLAASDPDGDTLRYFVGAPAHGTLSGIPPNLTYNPTADFFGADSFTFKVNDGQIDSATATVSITVLPVNDPPVARIAITPLFEFPGVSNLMVLAPGCDTNAAVRLDGSASSDIDNDPLTFAWYDGTNLIAIGVTATNQLGLGSHSIGLIVSDGRASGEQTVMVDVLGLSSLIDLLIAEVYESNLSPREQYPLVASLKAAAASLERCNFISAANQLRAVENKLRARPGVYEAQFANLLTEEIEIVLRLLNEP